MSTWSVVGQEDVRTEVNTSLAREGKRKLEAKAVCIMVS